MHNRLTFRGTYRLALVVWAVLGPATATSVLAGSLTLNSGDAITVSAQGTSGNVGTTFYTPPNSLTSYQDAGSSYNSAVKTAGTAIFTLNTGGTLTATGISSSGLLADGSGAIMINGGTISNTATSGYDVDAVGSSPITISGNAVLSATGLQAGIGLEATGNAITVSGNASLTSTGMSGRGLEVIGSTTTATVSGNALISASGQDAIGLEAYNSGPVLITSGTLSATGPSGAALFIYGSSVITVRGGTFQGGSDAAAAALYDTGSAAGSVLVTGGTFTGGGSKGNGLHIGGPSTVTVAGGVFTAGPGGYGLDAYGKGVINLFSQGDTPFLIDGVAMNNTTLQNAYTSGTDTISGILENGDVLNTTFSDNGTINLNIGTPPVISAVPEPSTWAAFAFTAFGVAGLGWKAKKRA